MLLDNLQFNLGILCLATLSKTSFRRLNEFVESYQGDTIICAKTSDNFIFAAFTRHFYINHAGIITRIRNGLVGSSFVVI